jgi:hypothetical protein
MTYFGLDFDEKLHSLTAHEQIDKNNLEEIEQASNFRFFL